jgi:GLPGLI family protein
MKKLLIFILILIPLAAAAQEGSITYDRVIKYGWEIPEAWGALKDQIPNKNTASMMLLFNGSESLMKEIPTKKEATAQTALGQRAKGAMTRLKLGSASRTDQETILVTYRNYEEGTFIEMRDFMSRTFLVSGDQPSYAWKLSGEQSDFLGFTVQKATAVQDSISIEAWFTPEIPISGGPGLFGELPGMILVVSVDDGSLVYSATEVDMDGFNGAEIEAPKNGQKESSDRYEEIVAEKLQELRVMRSRRARDSR